jgi:hypothetical protein
VTDNILQSALKAGCWLTDTGELVTDEIDLTAFVRNLMSSGFIDTTLDEAYQCGQEAVAWMDSSGHPKHLRHIQNSAERRLYGKLQPLYLHPQPATWAGLTDEEIEDLLDFVDHYNFPEDLIVYTQAKLKEKNT